MANQNYWDNMWKDSALLGGTIEETQNEYLGPEIARCLTEYCIFDKINFLEAGCGLGIWNFLLEKNPAVALSLGVDKTKSLWQAQKYKREHSYKSKFVQADVIHLPFGDEKFNFITSLGVIEHFHRPQILLEELKRVLVPGGVLFLDTPNKSLWSFFTSIIPLGEHEDYYRPRELAQLLTEAGFEVLAAYSKGFSNTVMTPLYMLYDYNPDSVLSRAYHFILNKFKSLIKPLDKRLDAKYGFYSIVIAHKI